MKRKTLSIILAAIMLISLLPSIYGTAFAAASGVMFTALDGTGGTGDEGYDKLIDGKKTSDDFSKWGMTFPSGGAYIVAEASECIKLNGYIFTTGNDNAGHTGRNPKDWVLYGSNNYDAETKTADWTAIHTVTNDTTMQDENYTSYSFTVMNAAYYKYYKLHITAIHSGSFMQLGEMEFIVDNHVYGGDDCTFTDSEFCDICGYRCPHSQTENNICSVCGQSINAALTKDGITSRFATLDAAVNEANKNGGTIKLLKNITLNNTQTITSDVTLDLNGYGVEMESTGSVFVIENGGKLVINDTYTSSDSGLFTAAEISGKEIVIDPGLTEIRDPYISGGNAEKGGGIYVKSGSTLEMNGGIIRDCTATYGDGIYIEENAKMIANGGTVKSSVYNAGTVEGKSTVFNAAVTNRGTISGGTFTPRNSDFTMENYGTISGGRFEIYQITIGSDVWDTYYYTVNNHGLVSGGDYYGKINNDMDSVVSGGDFENAASVTNIYTVTFDSNGGSGDSKQWRWNAPAANSDYAYRRGFVCSGWYTDTDCTDANKYDFTQNVSADITLYAKWCVFNQKVEDEKYLYCDANCQTPKTYYYSCDCGEKGTETFTVGDKDISKHTGTLSGWKHSIGASHYKTYSCCGATAESGNCTFADTDSCDVCGYTCVHNRVVSNHCSICSCDMSVILTKDDTTKYFITLGGAVKEANETGGCNIQLLKNITLNNTQTITSDVTIDLNGYSVKMAGTGSIFVVENGGHLAINDTYTSSGLMTASENEFVIDPGIIEIRDPYILGGNAEKGGGVYVKSGGTLEMKGGVIRDCTATYGAGVYIEENAKMITTDGTVKSNVYNAGTIEGGNLLYATEIKADVENYGTISGGEFVPEDGDFTVENYGTISGGRFKAYKDDTVIIKPIAYYCTVNNHGTISGGEFTGNVNNDKNAVVSGGNFANAESVTNVYTVTFESNGAGTVSKQWRLNAPATEPKNPTLSGATFKGWYSNIHCTHGNEYNFNRKVITDITLYAKWCIFNQKVENIICLYCEANCQTPQTYYYSCTCGEIGTETFTVGIINPSNHVEPFVWCNNSESGTAPSHYKKYPCCDTTTESENCIFTDSDSCDICGYMCSHEVDSDNRCTICNNDISVVLTKDDTTRYFMTLVSAIKEANETGGCNIKLLKNITLNNTQAITSGVTLDLNGYRVKMAGTGSVFVIENGGNLTINNTYTSSGSGLITAAEISENEVVINPGIIEIRDPSVCGGNAEKGGGVYVKSGGTLEMKGGVIRDCTATYGAGVYIEENAKMIANGGTVENSVYNMGEIENSDLLNVTNFITDMTNHGTISGGKFMPKNGDFTVENHGTISGGRFATYKVTILSNVVDTYYCTVNNHGTISGGTYIGKVNNDEDSVVSGGNFTNAESVTNVYTVTFDSNGGNSVSGQLRLNAPATAPKSVKREGYSCIGWYTAPSYETGTRYDFTKNITEDITIYAVWSAGEYAAAVIHDSVPVEYQTFAEAVAAASEYNECTIVMMANAGIDSIWTILKKTTLDLNGHNLTLNADESGNYACINVIAEFTLTDGSSSGIVYYGQKGCVTINGGKFNLENGKLYGNNTTNANVINISRGTFEMTGGVVGKEGSNDIIYFTETGITYRTMIAAGGIVNSRVSIEKPMVGGVKSFIRADENSSGCTVFNNTFENKGGAVSWGIFKGDVSVTGKARVSGGDFSNAKSLRGVYTVTFNSNGGSTVAKQWIANTAATEPTDPTNGKKIFKGWYTDEACTDENKYDFTQDVTENITLYAKWTDRIACDVARTGNTFTVTPVNIDTGSVIVFALYDGEKLVETEYKTYNGEALTFNANTGGTLAKVMAWKSIDNITPICGAAEVALTKISE